MPAKQYNLSRPMPRASASWLWAAPVQVYRWLEGVIRAHSITTALLVITLMQGLLYFFVLPPWQHYDEPTHFEYAWLIADRGRLPQPDDVDLVMRREVAASMLEHNFFWNMPRPDLLSSKKIEIGISELQHPPLYYILVSLPLRMVRALDITSQLYVARSVSLVLFVLTVAVVRGIMKELLPKGHPLGWAVPLTLALVPPFADIMTAVNNDVGAIFLFSLFLWLSIRAIRYGLSLRRIVLIVVTAGLATATKTTAAVALALTPVALTLALWHQRRWRWRWLAFTGVVAVLIILLSTFTWGDAATWYRGTSADFQDAATRVPTSEASHGRYAVQLVAPSSDIERRLINPLLQADVQRLAGRDVTFGGWVWTNQPGSVAVLGLEHSPAWSASSSVSNQPLALSTTPTFTAWTVRVPEDSEHLSFRFAIGKQAAGGEDVRVFLDGALLVEGPYAAITAPQFDTNDARTGIWNGQRFENLVRNGSAERAWPRVRPWLDLALTKYARRSSQLVISAMLDVERTGALLLYEVPAQVLFSFFGWFAWSNISLPETPWRLLFQGWAFLSITGCGVWLWRKRTGAQSSLLASLFFLGTAGVVVWGNVVLRVLPLLDGLFAYPVARYGFPAVLPALLLLVGGWWSLWPRPLRFSGLLLLLAGVAMLNVAALWTVWTYYQTIPS